MKAPRLDLTLEAGSLSLTGDFTEMLSINPDDIVTEMSQQPGMSAYVGAMVVEARRKHREAEAERDSHYAQLDSKIRARMEGTKYTEKSVTMEIELDVDYQALCRAAENAAMNVSLIENILTSFRERARMISDIAGLLRTTS